MPQADPEQRVRTVEVVSSARIGEREEPEALFDLANLEAAGMVEIECSYSRSADRRLPDEAITVPTKMGRPVVNARVKQRDRAIRIGVDAFHAVAFPQVTARTRQGKILELRSAPTRLWNNMLDVEGRTLE
jgi:hypothetical protein